MGKPHAKLAAFALLCSSVLASERVDAAWLSVTSRTLYQGSKIRLYDDRNDERFRNLNRFAEWLDVGGYAFGPGDHFDATVSVRYRTDFGTGFHRDTPAGLGVPAVDGRDDLEVLYAYVDWRDVVEGKLDLRFGRQLLIDDLDWFSLDGVKATSFLFRGARFELYLGRPVPYESFLSSEPFLYDGTELDDGFDVVFGGSAAFTYGNFSASAAYRHSFLFRGDDFTVFTRPGLSEEAAAIEAEYIRLLSGGTRGVPEASIGASLGYTIPRLKTDVYAHGVWNLVFGGLDQARAGIGFTPLHSVHAQAEFLRVYPRFAADSIFNYFNIQPYDRGRLELGVQIFKRLWITGGYFFQQFHGTPKGPRSLATAGTDAAGGEGLEFAGSDVAHGPRLEVTYRRASWGAGASAEASTNAGGQYAYGGNYRQFEIYGDWTFLKDRVTTGLRLNYTGAQTDWFAAIETGNVAPEIVSYGIILATRAQLTDALAARVDLIRNFESLIEGSYRFQSVLEVRYP